MEIRKILFTLSSIFFINVFSKKVENHNIFQIVNDIEVDGNFFKFINDAELFINKTAIDNEVSSSVVSVHSEKHYSTSLPHKCDYKNDDECSSYDIPVSYYVPEFDHIKTHFLNDTDDFNYDESYIHNGSITILKPTFSVLFLTVVSYFYLILFF